MKHYTITISAGIKWAFIEVSHGLYKRTHRCVNYVECPRCGAKRHECCNNGRGPVSEVHASRRELFVKMVRKELDAEYNDMVHQRIRDSMPRRA